ncbi:hypothetical protein LTR09_009061 [Extremus antarcticus]|uniref:Uncharacterized protein n=1 Tax=Extremus antarcticus TaxID=702011 RepID=A0AAJ0G9S5_9PEZI|nr:hypothetical protein LTR09_009061 [Extremus antarcticus]
MLRHYGRLIILITTAAICLVFFSLGSLPGVTVDSHSQGEELPGVKLGEPFASKHDVPDRNKGLKELDALEQALGHGQGHGNGEPPLDVAAPEANGRRPQDKPPVPGFARPEDQTIETDPQPPVEPQGGVDGNWVPPVQISGEAEDKGEEEEDPTPISKIIVVGQMGSENTDWVRTEMTEWQNAIYYVDLPANEVSPSGLKTKMNKAKEATPYLTYIVDNYPDFPDVMAFIHAHRRGMEAWHNDAPSYDAVHMLNSLRLDTILKRGYVNMRCNNEIGCPDEVQPFRDPPQEDKHAEHAYPYVYANFFNVSWEEMKEQIPIVATQCCAQFAVSREQMLKKPKSEYERYLRFLEETHYDDDVAGRVLEYMWHIIFERDAVHCENVFQCCQE